MKIRYFGQSCFLISSADGRSVVTDPFDNSFGYDLPLLHAEVVTVSHDHYDHNHTASLKGPFTLLDKPGHFDTGFAKISGLPSFHDGKHGAVRGRNIIFNVEMDGVQICHLGDLGHVPESNTLKAIEKTDVLLVPVGEVYTFSIAEALKTIQAVNPRLVIPMHYKTGSSSLPLKEVSKFLQSAEAEGLSFKHYRNTLEVTQDFSAFSEQIAVLDFE